MNFRILIAEDEEIALKHIVYALKQEGYDVVGTRNGREALSELELRLYDVLITDIKMPEMSGIELLEKAKKMNFDIKVIVITGFGTTDSAVEAIDKGAYEYIMKPFELDELLGKVKSILKRKVLLKDSFKDFWGDE